MIKVGIVGGTGYTGIELLRILARHPQSEIVAITSRKEAGVQVAELFPSLRGAVALAFSDPSKADFGRCDVVFFATPNAVAMGEARALVEAGVRVVDLAGQGTNVQASGRVFWDQQRKRWFVYIRDLPPVPADKSYQLWFVPKSGDPVSAEVFNTASNGSVQIEIDVPANVGDLKAAAVTTEPAGGLPKPSGPFSLLGAM